MIDMPDNVWVYPFGDDGSPDRSRELAGRVCGIGGSVLFVRIGDVINAVDPAAVVVRVAPLPEERPS